MTSDADTPPTVVLVTGFEPFGGSTLNPSRLIAERLPDALGADPGITLHTALLPVDTERAPGVVRALWDSIDPDIVLHFGESAKADQPTLERIAVNLLDFETPDNAGRLIHDTPIDPQGPAARFATLPVRAVQRRLMGEGIDTRLSLSAGAYLCNQVLYTSLAIGAVRGGRRVGFVHVPSLPEQVARGERDAPAMPADAQADSAAALVRAVVSLRGRDPDA